MKNLKISKQIGLGVGTVLMLLVLSSGFASYETFAIGESFDGFRDTENRTVTSNDVAQGVFETRMAAPDFETLIQDSDGKVEESAAAARTLSYQAGKPTEPMAFFDLDETSGGKRQVPSTSGAAGSSNQPGTAAALTALAKAGNDDRAEFRAASTHMPTGT